MVNADTWLRSHALAARIPSENVVEFSEQIVELVDELLETDDYSRSSPWSRELRVPVSAWGMIPIGLAIGGLLVNGAEAGGMDRVMALRFPYFVTAAPLFIVFLWGAPELTADKIETARAQGGENQESRVGESRGKKD